MKQYILLFFSPDFGFAQYLHEDTNAQMLRGSPLYMAPEIVTQSQYSPKADLWSIGVILFGESVLCALLGSIVLVCKKNMLRKLCKSVKL